MLHYDIEFVVKMAAFSDKGTRQHEKQSIALLAEDDEPNGKRKLNMHPRRCHAERETKMNVSM